MTCHVEEFDVAYKEQIKEELQRKAKQKAKERLAFQKDGTLPNIKSDAYKTPNLSTQKLRRGVTSKNRVCHSGWITKIKFYSDLNCIMTSSLDGKINIHSMNLEYSGKTFDKHQKPLNSFIYSPLHRFIASCGEERFILIWDPITRNT